MDDAAKAAKRKEIEEKVAAMKLEQKKLEVGVCGGRIGDVLFLSCVGESGGAFNSREEKFPPSFERRCPLGAGAHCLELNVRYASRPWADREGEPLGWELGCCSSCENLTTPPRK